MSRRKENQGFRFTFIGSLVIKYRPFGLLMKKSTRAKRNSRGVFARRARFEEFTSNDSPSVVHVHSHLCGEFLRFEVLNAQNDVFGGIFEVLSRHVTDFQLIGSGQNRTGRPFGQFKSVVTHFCGQNGTSLHVQLRSPI